MLDGPRGFTHVDPFEDTERLILLILGRRLGRFTHVDPFEDTERLLAFYLSYGYSLFHPRRSVRGY